MTLGTHEPLIEQSTCRFEPPWREWNIPERTLPGGRGAHLNSQQTATTLQTDFHLPNMLCRLQNAEKPTSTVVCGVLWTVDGLEVDNFAGSNRGFAQPPRYI